MSTALPPFEEIVTIHGPTVLRVCRAVLGPMDAEDAWSETFLAALRAYPTLRPGSNVEAWSEAARACILAEAERRREIISREHITSLLRLTPAPSPSASADG